jgi:hypothetical protein
VFYLQLNTGQGYREPIVRTHDQMSYIGPERAYAGPAVNLPVPVNMFIPPAMPQTFNWQPPMHMGKYTSNTHFLRQNAW